MEIKKKIIVTFILEDKYSITILKKNTLQKIMTVIKPSYSCVLIMLIDWITLTDLSQTL